MILDYFASFSKKIIGVVIKNIFLLSGPIYIKLGQIMSYDYPILKELYSLQNDCGPLPTAYFNDIKQRYPHLAIRDDYMSSGSIAAVHKCIYNDKECIVKIKRPGIKQQIEKNLRQINFILDYLPFLQSNACNFKAKLMLAINFYEIQHDFKNEVNNWRLYNKIFKNIVNVQIPMIYEDESTDDLILMEYVPGYNIVKNADIFSSLDGFKLHEKVNDNIKMVFINSMVNKLYHGDLHPGNFAFKEDGSLIIYDFGVCIDFFEDDTNILIDIIDSIYIKDYRETVSIFIYKYLDYKYNNNNEEYKEFLIDEVYYSYEYQSIIKKITSGDNFNFYDILYLLKKMIYKKGITINNNMIKTEFILVSLISTSDYTKKIQYDNNFLKIENSLFNDKNMMELINKMF